VSILLASAVFFFTNEPAAKIIPFFREYKVPECPRTGFVATREVVISAGILEWHPASLERRFRTLGVPTKLNNGQIEILGDYTVCREGEVLSPEQARILALLEDKMANFSIGLKCMWSAEKFEVFSEAQ